MVPDWRKSLVLKVGCSVGLPQSSATKNSRERKKLKNAGIVSECTSSLLLGPTAARRLCRGGFKGARQSLSNKTEAASLMPCTSTVPTHFLLEGGFPSQQPPARRRRWDQMPRRSPQHATFGALLHHDTKLTKFSENRRRFALAVHGMAQTSAAASRCNCNRTWTE